ncbi:MAG: amidase [Ferrovibrionaceae bacterium]
MNTVPAMPGVPAGAEDLARLTAAEMLAGYRARRFTPRDVVEASIAALKRTDAACNVVVTPLYDEALAAAEAATRDWRLGEPAGALAGLPVTVKDLVFVGGVPAKGGAPSLKDFVAPADAHVVARLREAGAIVLAKTTTCESGYKLTADSPLTGITRNPWALDRTSGGSSGGAAAAVAAGCGPLAVGTDGVGSIRVPASFCGVFGLKPTFGLVSRAPGFAPPSWASLAHTGPITRSVADAALMLEVIAGYDARDAASLPQPPRRFDAGRRSLSGLQIGYSLDLGHAAVDPAVRAAVLAAVDVVADLGATIVPIDPGIDPEALERILKPIAFAEQAASVGSRSDADFAGSDPEFVDVLKAGRRDAAVAYVEAMHRRSGLRARFHEMFKSVDALLTPTVAVTAFAAGTLGVDRIDGRAVDRHLGWSPFTWPMNLAGLPAASIPCGVDAQGLPIGLQIVAPWLGEPLILRIAAGFEAVRPWTGRSPSL